ncbi:alpha/beta hydrolase [Alteromonas pelagimontana]|uniref:Alpha/beta hydrolase n=1 Tax=Alteromonas pelagimontana TaxID=1858656 RepID=A0A6M4MEQ4_9ALTE|nr:alpha/beta hydrolase [Alteromonas pelagimontana]QJR81110.1 alpha/beta hydrolase [Alteromonas pelagimontana]
MSFSSSLPIAICLSALLTASTVAKDFTVDDSYSVSQRYYNNIESHPELVWPTLNFEQGQQVMFDRRYKVANDRELHLDIFLPAKAKPSKQAVMLIHGGGWRSGNKSHFYTLANLLAQRGYVVITPEYRLSVEAPYPAGLVDINDALVWVKENAQQFNIAPDSIALGGGSSGGHMAGLLGNTANQTWFKGSESDADTRVNAVIDLDGVLDFTHPLAIANENKNKEKSAAGLWFGGAMEDTLEKWEQASTAKHIHQQSPPMLIISSGQMRFTAGKDTVLEKLDRFGIINQYFQYEDNIHTYWLFDPYVTETADRIDAFLTRIAQQEKE